MNYTYSMKSDSGKLITEKAWRTLLNDDRIFLRSIKDEIPDMSVDIMLDASASQLNRQEIIAEEGYIIAESLTRCKIPVRIYSFCNMRDYTIVNLFRDYDEKGSNDKIFNYYAAGFNRDGMALRTAPVSYTHLDVYKRQGNGSLSDGNGGCLLYIPNIHKVFAKIYKK